MKLLSLLGILVFFCACSDNAFTPVDELAPRAYSSAAAQNSGSPDEAVVGYIGLWSGVLSSVDADAPQNIKVMDNGTRTSVSLDFGNGVIHTARVQGDYAILPLTGTSWRNAVEECPPTADLFVTLKLKVMEDAADKMSIENSLKAETSMHSDLFSLK